MAKNLPGSIYLKVRDAIDKGNYEVVEDHVTEWVVDHSINFPEEKVIVETYYVILVELFDNKTKEKNEIAWKVDLENQEVIWIQYNGWTTKVRPSQLRHFMKISDEVVILHKMKLGGE